MTSERVVPLRGLPDDRLTEGERDVRGWGVLSGDGWRIGTVSDLLVDAGSRRIRYLDVEFEAAGAEESAARVAVPVSCARMDPENDYVVVDRLFADAPGALPLYDGESVTREYEEAVRRHLDPDYMSRSLASADGDFRPEGWEGEVRTDRTVRDGEDVETRIVLSEEELSVGKRLREVGELVLSRRVETEVVRHPVQLEREQVEVERRPAPQGMGMEPRVIGDEILIPIVEEEVIVQKRRVVREVMVVRKEMVLEERVVETEVRRERMDVRREGDPRVAGVEAEGNS